MSYVIKINDYDGPLDLLCSLIYKNKIDIKNIFINQIIKQYLAHIDEITKENIEDASDFLTIATKLLKMKSNSILSIHNEIEEEEEALDLAEKLKEYSKYKNASIYLRENVNLNQSVYHRLQEECVDEEEVIELKTINQKSMLGAIKAILDYENKNKNEVEEDIEDDKLKKIYKAPTILIETKMDEVTEIMNKRNKLLFKDLVTSKEYVKEHKIATFLAVLELSRSKFLTVDQEECFKDITIEKNTVEI